MLPEIDVIIPFHVIHEYLHQAIESVLDSKGVEVRLILVDDSEAELPSWMNEILTSTTVKYVKNQDKGYLGALHTGIKNCISEYIGFLDSDDLTHELRYCEQIQFMRDNRLDISSSRLIRIDKHGNKLRGEGLLGSQFSNLNPKFRILLGAYGADSSMVAKREVLQSNWKIHQNHPAQFADYALLLSLFQNFQYSHLPTATYYYRSHEFQMSRKNTLLADWEKVFPLWLKHLKFLGQDLPKSTSININSKVAAAVAFPSLLPKLNLKELQTLKIFIKCFLLEVEGIQKLERQDRNALGLRILIASKGRDLWTLCFVPLFVWQFIKQTGSGIVPRRN